MHAGSSPKPTRSVHNVHLETFPVVGFSFGTSNGQPVMQYPQPMQLSATKSTMPLLYCTMAPGAGQALRQPGSTQCIHWYFDISHRGWLASVSCSLNLIRFQKLGARSGIV